MNRTQYVIFEATTECQMAEVHRACPIRDARRARRWTGRAPLEDAEIIEAAVALYREHGFRGLVGWHYYGEPALAEDRISGLIDGISARVSEARYTLWTNGLAGSARWLGRFVQVIVTDYGLPDERLAEIRPAAPMAIVRPARFDARRNPPGVPRTWSPCSRMFAEMIFDYYGVVHACCYDWAGEIDLGALPDDPLGRIVERWHALRAALGSHRLRPETPEICRRCAWRSPNMPRLWPLPQAAMETVPC